MGSSCGDVEIRFIDLDWGGLSSVVRYPPFINLRQDWWPMQDPTDQPITQDHDRYTLNMTIQRCRGMQPPSQGAMAAGIKKRPREKDG